MNFNSMPSSKLEEILSQVSKELESRRTSRNVSPPPYGEDEEKLRWYAIDMGIHETEPSVFCSNHPNSANIIAYPMYRYVSYIPFDKGDLSNYEFNLLKDKYSCNYTSP